ncbi:MAG TPA: citrate/2-methylcitrate synthase [Candidatus Deferrimicrobium sp.]|nr:citrate/2-methylcitrate synthase [Candidatus Deferrimicrobium sp.]
MTGGARGALILPAVLGTDMEPTSPQGANRRPAAGPSALSVIDERTGAFVERKLYPNVDFYSGLIYEAIGLPVDTYTTMFAVARMAGWVAQWREMIADPEQKIARPRQIYTGLGPRDVPPPEA